MSQIGCVILKNSPLEYRSVDIIAIAADRDEMVL